ncbi:MAG: hypothetical protein NTY45_10495 [Elusimicrobia bacterium]|nr:hypothetical protein [Elusimicrobiota bacterium]
MRIKTGVAGLLLLGTLLGGCGGKSDDLSTDPEYAYIMGHVFETTSVMLIISRGPDSIALEVPGTGGAPELSELPADLPYKDYNGDIVLGVMPAGSRFQVVRVYRGWSTVSGGYISYVLRMQTPKEYSNWNLSDIGLIDYGVRPGRFKKKLIREVVWRD